MESQFLGRVVADNIKWQTVTFTFVGKFGEAVWGLGRGKGGRTASQMAHG